MYFLIISGLKRCTNFFSVYIILNNWVSRGIEHKDLRRPSIEFSLNVFAEFSDKNICHNSKCAQTGHPATSCVRDQDATTAPKRHT